MSAQEITPAWVEGRFRDVIDRKASDLYLSMGKRPCVRVNRQVTEMAEGEPMTSVALDTVVRILFPGRNIETATELDAAYAMPSGTRFRLHAFRQRGTWSLVARIVPTTAPLPADIDVPLSALRLTEKTQGLILVTGATGSGKSTTVASLVRHINEAYYRHIVTIEDPVEYIHSHKLSIIQQREIPTDVPSYAMGLHAALREAADVIVVGELRDLDSMRTAIHAAETGHLVFGTLHTSSATEAVDRLIDAFPSPERPLITSMLANSLLGVIAQMLIPRANNSGMLACFEIMVANPGVKAIIRKGQTAQLLGAIQTGGRDGMQTLEQHLEHRVKCGQITLEAAMRVSNRPDELKNLDRPAMIFTS